jgi:chemotaxis protein histidine kinase CheA
VEEGSGGVNQLLAQFLADANDLLASADDGLRRLERNPGDAEPAGEVFRAVHTFKGSCGLFDLPALTRLAHAAEDLLDAARAGRSALDSSAAGDLVAAFDLIRGWLAHISAHERLPATAGDAAAELIIRLRAPLGAGRATADQDQDRFPVRRIDPPPDRPAEPQYLFRHVPDQVTVVEPDADARTPPHSAAVTPVMVVIVAGQRFGVPIDVVVETVRVPAAAMSEVPHQDVVVIRGEVVPVTDLARALGMPWSQTPGQDRAVLVVAVNRRRTGLLVERFHGEADVLLKPMEGLLAHVAEFSGTALLGDGLVLLVLNLEKVLDRPGRCQESKTAAASASV